MKKMTLNQLRAAVKNASSIPNKIERMRTIQNLGPYAVDEASYNLVRPWIDISREIIEDVKKLNELRFLNRRNRIYLDYDGGIVSLKNMCSEASRLAFPTNFYREDHYYEVEDTKLTDHGNWCYDRNGYCVILSAPYGTQNQIRETSEEIFAGLPVELEFSPGNGIANHHAAKNARGLAIRSARAAPVIWPDYYHEYAESFALETV